MAKKIKKTLKIIRWLIFITSTVSVINSVVATYMTGVYSQWTMVSSWVMFAIFMIAFVMGMVSLVVDKYDR